MFGSGEKRELQKEIRKLKEEVADLKLQKKIEDEDIKHMVKIKQEQLELDFQKKSMNMENEKNEEIMKTKDEYRNKLEEFLKSQVQDVKEMYGQILNRLPDVNVKLRGNV